MLNINKLKLTNKKVILRCGLDVKIDKKNNKIVSDFRIKKQIPFIKRLLKAKAKVIILSHLGRPKGNGYEEKYSLRSVAERLGELLKKDIAFAPDCIGDNVSKFISESKDDIVLLENVRFHKDELRNCSRFAKKIAKLGDLYINNAFSVSHRKNSSICAITKYLPSYPGDLLLEEVKTLDRLLSNMLEPFMLVVGGAKIGSKIKPIMKLGVLADNILLGGALANTFCKSLGYDIGSSMVRDEEMPQALSINKKFKRKILLPIDVKVVDKNKNINRLKKSDNIDIRTISLKHNIIDIGKNTYLKYKEKLAEAKTVFWAGPIGAFEFKELAPHTISLMKFITKNIENTYFAGGETITALEDSESLHKATHAFVGGSAALEYISGKKLPGLKVLDI